MGREIVLKPAKEKLLPLSVYGWLASGMLALAPNAIPQKHTQSCTDFTGTHIACHLRLGCSVGDLAPIGQRSPAGGREGFQHPLWPIAAPARPSRTGPMNRRSQEHAGCMGNGSHVCSAFHCPGMAHTLQSVLFCRDSCRNPSLGCAIKCPPCR